MYIGSRRTFPHLQLLTRNLAFSLGMALLAGCGGGGDEGDDPGDGGGDPADIVLTDDNNYTAVSTLSIPKVMTEPSADLDICWSDLMKDIQCHDIDAAADIDAVAFLRIPNLTEEEIEEKLAAGTLAATEVKKYFDFRVGDSESTCTTLGSFKVLNTTPIVLDEDFVEGEDKYLMLFSTGTTLGVGARAMTFVEPVSGEANTTVNAPSDCEVLDFAADITTPAAVEAPADGPWVVDWSELTRDSTGNNVVFQNLDRLLVAFYADMTVAELQENFLDIEIMKTSLYEVAFPKGDRKADLADAREVDSDEPFEGFDRTDGVWAIGLMCSTCQNPAPVFLSVVEPK